MSNESTTANQGVAPEPNPNQIIVSQEQFQELISKMKAKDIADIDPKFWEAMVQNMVNFWAYTTNMEIMGQIVGSMKEIPQLPSEIVAPQDTHPLKYVEFLPEGGMLTHMEGYDQPYRGFPFFEFVDRIDLIKKISRQIQSGYYHAFVNKSKWKLLLLLPFLPWIRGVFYAHTYTFFRVIERFRLLPNRYSKAVRELYRAFSVERPGETEELKNLRLMMRDIECMILEFDNAYRFRTQDILQDLDKEALKKNPLKEINRILELIKSREKTPEIKDTWKLLQFFTKFYLRFDRQLLKLVVDVLMEINPKELVLTKEDNFYAEHRKDYTFPIRVGQEKP